MATCAQGALAKLIVEPGSGDPTFDSGSEAYDFLYEDISLRDRLVGGRAIMGTRSNYAARMRQGHQIVAGRLATYTCPADLDNWLPRILGAAESTEVFHLDDSLATNGPFAMLIDRVGGIFSYDDCYIDSAIWRAQAGPGDDEPELVEQILNIVGQEEVLGRSWPSPAPTISIAANRAPFTIADSTLTIGSAYKTKNWVVVVDNHLQPRWVNSVTPTALCPGDRTVMLRATFPFTSTDDAVFSGLYQHASRLTGVAASLALQISGAAYSTTFTFTSLQWVRTTPIVRGKQEIDLVLDFVARKTSAGTDEVYVTNDNTA